MATTADIPDFTNATQWERRPGVNVFDEHERKLTRRKKVDGKDVDESVTVQFKKHDLEQIAAECNERDRTGNFCALSLGHTLDGRPEIEQPPHVGYARQFYVAYDNTLKRYVIRATYYIRRDRLGAAVEFPRTSVEYWHDRKFFDPIALLRRTPARDLGQWTYALDRGEVLPISVLGSDGSCALGILEKGQWTYARSDPSQLVLRYAMAEEVIKKEEEVKEKPEHKHQPDPTLSPGGPEGVPPEFSEHFMKCAAHHFPKLAEMHSKYGMGTGGPAAGAVPAPVPPIPPPLSIHPEPPIHMSKSEVERLSKVQSEIDALRMQMQAIAPKVTETQTQYAETQAWRASLERENRLFRFERDLTQMALKYSIDLVEEMNRVKDYSQDQFDSHMHVLQKYASPNPVTATTGWLPTEAPKPTMQFDKDKGIFRASGGPETGRQERVFGEAELEIADRYMAENPEVGWKEARAHAMGEGKPVVPVR